jgi:hypothetical protein
MWPVLTPAIVQLNAKPHNINTGVRLRGLFFYGRNFGVTVWLEL